LNKGLTWDWTTSHDDAFKKARIILSEVRELAFYDLKRPTSLHVDASRLYGLGFLLKQRDPKNTWQVVQAGSRFISSAESRYAMIELECLGASWAMHKCRQFLEGLPTFELVTDHKPLVPILNDYALDKLDNPRLLRLRLKMQRYSFIARWIPGKQTVGADALSRAPVEQPLPTDELGEGQPSFSAKSILIGLIDGTAATDVATIDPVLEKMRQAALSDPTMTKLRRQIITGFPNDKCNLEMDLLPYWCVRERLAIDEVDEMIVVGSRIVVPQSMRAEILRQLVTMHQGATKTRQRARTTVYWPNMDNDIANATKNCETCIKRLPSQPPVPFKRRPEPTRPFEHINADIGTLRQRNFLVMVDAFSGWPHVVAFPDTKTST
jgi:hypothetical protein